MATQLTGKQIDLSTMVSTSQDNLLQVKNGGLYAALTAVTTTFYVSSVSGNDSNPGTKAAPLKSLWKAIFSFPDYTSGTIYLKEGETFDWRDFTLPAFGSTVTQFGYMVSTGNRSLTIRPYGTQSDAYDAKSANTNFYWWALANFPRPTIRFGHFLFNGTGVGQGIALGGSGGQRIEMYGMNFAFTDEAKAATVNTGYRCGGGYFWPLESGNTMFFGCTLPSPFVTGSGVDGSILRVSGTVVFWDTKIDSGTSQWFRIGDPSRIQLSQTGAMTDSAGAQYTSQGNTISVNLASRTDGVLKDSNGVPRNVQANFIF